MLREENVRKRVMRGEDEVGTVVLYLTMWEGGGGGEGCVRDCASFEKEGVLSKRDFGAFKGTSLLGSGVESPLIFYTKKKNFNTKYIFKIL